MAEKAAALLCSGSCGPGLAPNKSRAFDFVEELCLQALASLPKRLRCLVTCLELACSGTAEGPSRRLVLAAAELVASRRSLLHPMKCVKC